jgi:amino acid permease
MVTAVFAYLGTELVGVTVGEAENPRKTIPRVSKPDVQSVITMLTIFVL